MNQTLTKIRNALLVHGYEARPDVNGLRITGARHTEITAIADIAKLHCAEPLHLAIMGNATVMEIK
jgi:hypothetical protein